MIAEATASYKDLLIQAKELRGKAAENAWKRAKLLVNVYNDRDFIDQECDGDYRDAESLLNGYVDDLCLTFLELRDMLKQFPKRTQWAHKKLTEIKLEAVAAQKLVYRSQRSDKPKESRLSPTNRRSLEQQAREAESRAAYFQKQAAAAQTTTQAAELQQTIEVSVSPQRPRTKVDTTDSPVNSVPRRGLDLWSTLSDDERRYLIDSPEFQHWCREHGFEIRAANVFWRPTAVASH